MEVSGEKGNRVRCPCSSHRGASGNFDYSINSRQPAERLPSENCGCLPRVPPIACTAQHLRRNQVRNPSRPSHLHFHRRKVFSNLRFADNNKVLQELKTKLQGLACKQEGEDRSLHAGCTYHPVGPQSLRLSNSSRPRQVPVDQLNHSSVDE